MTRTADEKKAEWITAAGEAFTAIRLVTGYGNRTNEPLDEETVYAISQLADMLHNIGGFATGDALTTLGFDHHSPESLDRVRASTRALVQRYHNGLPHLRRRDYFYDTGKKPGLVARIAHAITG